MPEYFCERSWPRVRASGRDGARTMGGRAAEETRQRTSSATVWSSRDIRRHPSLVRDAASMSFRCAWVGNQSQNPGRLGHGKASSAPRLGVRGWPLRAVGTSHPDIQPSFAEAVCAVLQDGVTAAVGAEGRLTSSDTTS